MILSKKLFVLTIILSIAIQCQGQQQLSLLTSQNEVRRVDIVSQFGLATANYLISSPSGSQYSFDQPLTSTENDTFFASSRAILQATSQQVDTNIVQQLQLYVDLSLEDQKDAVMLSLIQIDQSANTPVITEIANENLSTKFNGDESSFEAVLITKSTGMLLYTLNSQSYVSVIQLDANQKFTFTTPFQIQNTSKYLRYNYDPVQNLIFFTLKQTSNNLITLRNIDLSGNASGIMTQQKLCSDFNTPNIVFIPYYQANLVSCRASGTNEYTYYAYYIDIVQNQLKVIQSTSAIAYLPGFQIGTFFVNDMIFVVTALIKGNIVNVAKLTLNQGLQQIEQVMSNIDVPVNVSGLNGCFVSSDQLLTLITSDTVLGISITDQQVISQIINQPITNFVPFEVNYYGQTIVVQQMQSIKGQNTKFASTFLQTKTPVLTFSQTSKESQQYVLSLEGDALKRQFTVSSSLITSDSTTVIVTQQYLSSVSTLTSYNSDLTVQIEKALIGYISGGTLTTTFSNAKLSSIDLAFNQQIRVSPQALYSTFYGIFLIQNPPNSENTQYSIQYSSVSLSSESFSNYGTFFQTTPILSVDEQSGYFVNTNSSGNQQISIYLKAVSSDKSFTMAAIDPKCNNQAFLYSGDPINNQVAVLCGNSLSLIKFSLNKPSVQYRPYPLSIPTKIITGTINKIEIQRSGLLYLTDGQTIVAINSFNNVVVGSVLIPSSPSGKFTGQVIFFNESFVVVYNESNVISVSQYSYNNFNGSTATLLRTFLPFGFNWTGKSFKAIRNFKYEADREFLVIDALGSDNTITNKLFYRISSSVQAQNQLLNYIPVKTGTLFFAVYSSVGTFTNGMYSIYKLNYEMALVANVNNLTADQFNKQISSLIQGELTVNNNQASINLSVTYYRYLSFSFTQIMKNNPSVQNFISTFKNNQLAVPSTYSFDGSDFTNGHLGNWSSKQTGYSFTSVINVTQRLQKTDNSYQSSQSTLQVMPDLLITSNSEGVYLEGKQLVSTYQNDCSFYMSQSKLDQTITDGTTTIKQTVYSISNDYQLPQSTQTITLMQYDIVAVYQPQTTNPNLSTTITTYTYQSSILLNKIVKQIQQDSVLGLLALVENQGGQYGQVCLIVLNQDRTFSLDCNVYQSLTNLQIVNIVNVEIANSNVFVTVTGAMYSALSKDLSTYQSINLNQSLFSNGKKINQSATIGAAQKLSSSQILVQYDDGILFVVTLKFTNNQIQFSGQVLTLFGQDQLRYAGAFYMNSINQIFILYQLIADPSQNLLVMYEPYYYSSTEYVIQSTYAFDWESSYKNAIIIEYQGELFVSLSSYSNKAFTPLTFQINIQTIINFATVQYQGTTSSNTVNFDFTLNPFFNGNNLYLTTPVGVSGNGGKTTNSLALSFSFIALLLSLIALI